jgi:prepilin-type N-terminal cleavage/methylation domain-containing protein
MPRQSHRKSERPRRGFTIIELLVVVVIIAVLMTLTIYVVGSFVTQAREAATQATIRKIQSMLNQRAEALQRMLKRKGYLDGSNEFLTTGRALANTYSISNAQLQRILATKLIYRKYFPQQLSEVDLTLQPTFQGVSSASSGEILYDFLTQANVLGDLPIGTDAFTPNEVRDTDGNGLLEFVDAWGNPLRFYRWPTRLFRPAGYGNGASPNSIDITNARVLISTLPSFTGNPQYDLSRDPEDPLRLCTMFHTNATNPLNIEFEDAFASAGVYMNTAGTYHVMLVVSSGPDGILGLYEPNDTTSKGHLAAVRDTNDLADDITFLSHRAGGK